MSDASDKKADLRRDMRRALDALPSAEKSEASATLRKHVLSVANRSCAIFAASRREPNLLPLIEHHPEVRWFLPRVIADGIMTFHQVTSLKDLRKGSFGIHEPLASAPISPSQIDTIICPGLAFTKKGIRLGQGGGFYDRYLAQAPAAIPIGVCFDQQLLPEIPAEEHDFRVSRVLYPSIGS